jgi:hypothetical protein
MAWEQHRRGILSTQRRKDCLRIIEAFLAARQPQGARRGPIHITDRADCPEDPQDGEMEAADESPAPIATPRVYPTGRARLAVRVPPPAPQRFWRVVQYPNFEPTDHDRWQAWMCDAVGDTIGKPMTAPRCTIAEATTDGIKSGLPPWPGTGGA